MSSKTQTERRHDRDMRPITSDSDDNWQARIYRRAEKRSREAQHEAGLQSLRDRIGLPTPPRTLRERIMAKIKAPKPPSFDVRAELKKAREERERREKVYHP